MIASLLLYSVVFLSSSFFGHLFQKSKNVLTSIFFFVLLLLPPVLLSSFRVGIGTDYYGYYESFRSIKASISFSNIFGFYQEPSWVLVNLLSPDYFHVLLISSIIYSFFISLSIVILKDRISVGFALFVSYMVFYCLSFNGIRQSIAASIIIFSTSLFLKYKNKKSLFLFFLLVVFAGSFHKTAFICLLIPLVYLSKTKNLFGIIIFFSTISLLFVIFNPVIANFLNRLNLYTSYLDGSDYGGFGFFLYILPLVFFIVLILRRIKTNDRDIYFLFKLYLFQIPFQLLGVFISFADRIAEYGLISQIILIPLLVGKIQDKKEKQTAIVTMAVWYVFYFFIMFVILKSNGVFPYFPNK